MINYKFLLLVFLMPSDVFANDIKCDSAKHHIGFFNGVNNTPFIAQSSYVVTIDELKLSGIESSATSSLYYNKSYSLIDDLLEVYVQKTSELYPDIEDRMDIYISTISGENSLISSDIDKEKYIKLRESLTDVYLTKTKNHILKDPKITEFSTSLIHKKLADSALVKKESLIYLAHSQGNFYVNRAYQYAKSKGVGNAIGIIHVAPPSRILNGKHVLADGDLVIKAVQAKTVNWTDKIGLHHSRPPGLNGKKDFLGHGYLEIYLNPTLTTYNSILNEVKAIDEKFDDKNCFQERAETKAKVEKLKVSNFSTYCNKGTYDNNCVHIPKMASKAYEMLGKDLYLEKFQKAFEFCNKNQVWYEFSVTLNRKKTHLDLFCGYLPENQYKESIPLE